MADKLCPTWLEQRLLALGFHLVLVTRRADSFEHALQQRLKVSGNPSQYTNISLFIEEQEEYRQRVSTSTLVHLEVDISDGMIERAAEQIGNWLESTGGLYAK